MPADLIKLPVSKDVRRRAVAVREKDIAADVAEAVRLDRMRVSELLKVAQQASQLGVTFNITEAIEAGMVVDAAREYVMTVATMERDDVR